MNLFSWLSTGTRRARVRRLAAAVDRAGTALGDVAGDELRRRSLELRNRARAGAEPAALIADAFPLMREACARALGLRHYDVQVQAGAALCERTIVEMQTGEGKTLTAALPLYVFALYGRGAYLATSNDYLAQRDADWLRPAFDLLGLRVGAVVAESSPAERRTAYRSDVTYGTGKEFGFDFLRDRLQAAASVDARETARNSSAMQRAPYFMLVDEADSVLIDDAGTPLIIAAAPRPASSTTAARFVSAAEQAARFQEAVHFTFDESRGRVELTAAGRMLVRSLPLPAEASGVGWSTLYEDAERAVLARRNFHPERQYVVRDGAVAIVDEFTGRIAEGRKWRDGLHQAVEAQERLPITDDGGQAARITVQEFFRRFPHLAGMTGTAATSAREFRQVYGMATLVVPTHRPSRRVALPPQIFPTDEAKWRGVVEEVTTFHRNGRPVLVGTRSIDRSQRLSQLLEQAGIPHAVLNAKEVAREAEIVSRAGQAAAVTVATNMAGRGTDIALGPGVAERGGLHVVLTEMHDAARIDRQLIGRGARQGDPGSFRVFVSLEDDLLVEAFGPQRAARLRHGGGERSSVFQHAQRTIERRHEARRRALIHREQQRRGSAESLGLDPCLDLPD